MEGEVEKVMKRVRVSGDEQQIDGWMGSRQREERDIEMAD